MAPSSQDAQSQPRRPAMMARQSSSSSYLTSQSPSDGISSSHRAAPHKHHRHVVGQSRVGPRNTSFGKNLNKLNKPAQPPAADAAATAKHHRRSHSGNSTSTPSSPRPGVKRNASTVGIVRHNPHTHAALKKNHSSGHLSRQGSSKNMLKATKSDVAPPKRSLAHPGKTRHTPDDHPTVHFDIGNDEAQEDAWTEESASQSPTTTRSNTRQNSVILDTSKVPSADESETEASEPAGPVPKTQDYHTPPSPMTRYQPDQVYPSRQPNGSSSHHSRPADADMITSRLLQRSASHNLPPQVSMASATVVADSHDPRSLGHSQASTLGDTPGRDLVSRFMDGDSSGGTPNSNFIPSRNSPKAQSATLNTQQRNKSAPNMAATATHSRAQSRRSGTSTPTDLPPSRTQQKLLLQRASSNIEPQKLVPVILPRTGGPTLLNSGMPYPVNSEGRLDPRLKHQFEHISQEYKVIRRYRNPLADAINRLDQMPSRPRKSATAHSSIANGFVAVGSGLDGIGESPNASFRDSGSAGEGADRRRSRVSFDVGRGDGDAEGRQSFDSDNGRVRNEVDEICRRLWESTEIVDSE